LNEAIGKSARDFNQRMEAARASREYETNERKIRQTATRAGAAEQSASLYQGDMKSILDALREIITLTKTVKELQASVRQADVTGKITDEQSEPLIKELERLRVSFEKLLGGEGGTFAAGSKADKAMTEYNKRQQEFTDATVESDRLKETQDAGIEVSKEELAKAESDLVEATKNLDLSVKNLNEALEGTVPNIENIRKLAVALGDLETRVKNTLKESESGTSANTTTPTQKFSTGGRVPGWGGGDRVRAMLEPGEWVINKHASRRFNPILDAINTGNMSKLARYTMGAPTLAVATAGGGSTGRGVTRLDVSFGGDAPVSIHARQDEVKRFTKAMKMHSRGKL
jgi:hypothetical protein